MMMFAILFGLSMDYEVFLLSRVREEYHETGDNTGSVVTRPRLDGPGHHLGGADHDRRLPRLRPGDDPVVKMMGLGLAVAIFVDATIVRVVLVPATMALLGDANWWLPGWLDRILPHIDVEGGTGLPAPEYEDERVEPEPTPEVPEPDELVDA